MEKVAKVVSGRGGVYVAALVLESTTCFMYTFGNLLPYLASSVTREQLRHAPHTDTEAAYAADLSKVSWVYTALLVSEAMTMLFTGAVELRLGPRVTASIGCVSIILSLLVLALFSESYGAIMASGVLCGVGVGVLYPVPIVVILRWFQDPKSSALGPVLSVSIGFGFVVNILFTHWINPDDLDGSPTRGFVDQPALLANIEPAVLFMVAMLGMMQVFGLLFLRNPPELQAELETLQHSPVPMFVSPAVPVFTSAKTSAAPETHVFISPGRLPVVYHSAGQPSLPFDPTLTIDTTPAHSKRQIMLPVIEASVVEYTPQEATKFVVFWQLMMIGLCNIMPLFFVPMVWKIFAIQYLGIQKDSFLATAGAVSLVAAGIGRTFWSWLYAKLRSIRLSFGVQTALLAVFLGCSPLVAWVEKPEALFFVWLTATMFCTGGAYVFFPNIVRETFGTKYTGVLLGCFYVVEMPGAAISSCLFGFSQSLGWPVVMGFVSFVAVVDFVCVMFLRPVAGASCCCLVNKKELLRRKLQTYGSFN